MTQPEALPSEVSHFLSGEASPEWDALVARNEDPHFEQLSAWGEAQRLRGWVPVRLLQYRGQSLTAGAQVLEKRIGRFWRAGYLRRGPLFAGRDAASRDAFATELQRVCRARRYVYFVVVLPYHGDEFAAVLARRGFAALPDGFPPSTPMKATTVLDVTRSDEGLLAGMHRTTRQNVRKSARGGVTVRCGGAADVPVFEGLLKALCDRRGVRPNIPGGAFLTRLWGAFAASDQAAIFVAEAGQVPIAARFVFSVGPWVTDWRHGWSGERPDLYPNEALDWRVIQWARARGARYYDFCGIDTCMAQKLSRGEALLPGEFCGMSSYKLGFGGEILTLTPDVFWSASRFLRAGVRSKRLSGAAMRVAGPMLGRAGLG